MPTFKYRLNSKTAVQLPNKFGKEDIERDSRCFFEDVLLYYFAKKFGFPSLSRSSPIDHIMSITAPCTEKKCDEGIAICIKNLYLCESETSSAGYYFVSIQDPIEGCYKYQLYSTVSRCHEDEEQKERNGREIADSLFGSQVDELSIFEHDGTLVITAYCTKIKRDEIVANCLSSIHLSADKIYSGDICFWPEYARGVEKHNRVAAEDRASALFESKSVEDPLDRSKSHTYWKASSAQRPTAFKLEPAQFLRRAQMMPPVKPMPTASSFSQWVYSLYGNECGDDEDRELGTAMEQVIWDRRKKAACSVDDDLLRSVGSDWRLVHNGLHLNGREQTNYFEINNLRVNGEPLRASPDLLYQNSSYSEVIIVEIKYSWLPITTNLWPNVWAQLWCYSQIEIAQNARKLAVVGEVWGERKTRSRGQGRKRVEGDPLLCLRASVRRDPRALAYDRFFRRLFDIYSEGG